MKQSLVQNAFYQFLHGIFKNWNLPRFWVTNPSLSLPCRNQNIRIRWNKMSLLYTVWLCILKIVRESTRASVVFFRLKIWAQKAKFGLHACKWVPALVKIQAAATKIYILVKSDQKKSADDHQWLQPYDEFAWKKQKAGVVHWLGLSENHSLVDWAHLGTSRKK